MHIMIADLKKNYGAAFTYSLRETFPSLSIGGEPIKFAEPVRVEAEALNTGRTVLVQGTLAAQLELTCARCLEPFRYDITTPYREEFRQAGEAMDHSNSPGSNDVEEINLFAGDAIDLNDTVTSAILLDLPMKMVCHPECKGLCPQCGINLNEQKCQCSAAPIDSRFAALAKLLKS